MKTKIKDKIAELPFPLTEAQQRRSLSEIPADMKSGGPIRNRLSKEMSAQGKQLSLASLCMGLYGRDFSLPSW